MYKSTYPPFLFLFFLSFSFHSVFSLSFHLFSSRYSKKNPSPIEAVSLFGNFMNPQLYRCHLLSIRSKRSCVASSAIPVKTSLPPALLSICREIKLVKTQLGGVISNIGQDIMNPQLYRCHLLFYSHIYKLLF